MTGNFFYFFLVCSPEQTAGLRVRGVWGVVTLTRAIELYPSIMALTCAFSLFEAHE